MKGRNCYEAKIVASKVDAGGTCGNDEDFQVSPILGSQGVLSSLTNSSFLPDLNETITSFPAW